ncbi:lipid II flippase MurJ [Bradyrhizobium sp. JR3.5]
MAEQQDRAGQARVIGIASIIWASSIFLSRVMGLVREQIIGRTLGASRMADLYFASFTLPDFLNYLLAAGALSIVFIPIFLAHLERGDHERGWESLQRDRELHRRGRDRWHRSADDIRPSAGNSGCPGVQQ